MTNNPKWHTEHTESAPGFQLVIQSDEHSLKRRILSTVDGETAVICTCNGQLRELLGCLDTAVSDNNYYRDTNFPDVNASQEWCQECANNGISRATGNYGDKDKDSKD